MRKRKARTKLKPRRRQRRKQNDRRSSIVSNTLEEEHPPPPPPLPPYYTKKEVLAFVRRTWPALWNMVRAGKFPKPHALFGEPIWFADDVRAWFATLPERSYKPLEGDDAA